MWAPQPNPLWRSTRTRALLSLLSWHKWEDSATNATGRWTDSAAGVPSLLLPRVTFPCRGVVSCYFSEPIWTGRMAFWCLLICQCLYVWQNSEWDLPSFSHTSSQGGSGEGKYGSHMPLTSRDHHQNLMKLDGLKYLGQLSITWQPCLNEWLSHWLGLLEKVDTLVGPSNASQVFSPVTLELTLKNTGVRLCLLLTSRECKPRHFGETVYRMDKEERRSAKRKGEGTHVQKQG